MSRLPVAPPGLSSAARKLWHIYVNAYVFDEVQLHLLHLLCTWEDNRIEARAAKDRPNEDRATGRIQKLAKDLGVTLEVLQGAPGRPHDSQRRRA